MKNSSYYRTLILLLAFSSVLLFTGAGSEEWKKREYVIIENDSVSRSQKEALLIIPGFGTRSEGVKDIAEYFGNRGYDLFIPSYISRDSLNACVANLDRFIKKQKLSEYKRVHVFSYIIGSWTINRWMKRNPDNNIATVIYDRSPLQERAPYAIDKDLHLIVRLLEGDIVREFSTIPYEPITNDSTIQIGLIIESRATKLIRNHKKSAMELGPVDWTITGRNQNCDDHFYTVNNHDEMYHDFSLIGPEIFHFIKNGKFTDNATETLPQIDHFQTKKPKGVL
jgi:hypothetical protein